ncbi:Uncharacterized protein FWK35_00029861 [Aphis craccivora]|uniref:Uncharacterized protein n=1 Tax=Aphis craccivora TaxID=307492 RepID=A0A6G0W0I8_APHCR|nr:Uncharacterized protein FWK35_00029861 [Aphis craccivora]
MLSIYKGLLHDLLGPTGVHHSGECSVLHQGGRTFPCALRRACSSRSSFFLVDRIVSTMRMNSTRLVSNCLIILLRDWASSGKSCDRGPHRISSTSPAFGGRLIISVIRTRSLSHLGQVKTVCSTVSSGSTQYTQ